MNTLLWNRVRYTLYSPFYDLITRSFERPRSRSIEILGLEDNESVLISGVGTGSDLVYIPKNVQITAVDITPAMVERSKERAQEHDIPLQAAVMDVQALKFADASFDAVVLHLIVAVVPDGRACLLEAARVLKPNGRMVIFDKFLPDGEQASLPKRIINFFAKTLFSDMNRQLRSLLKDIPLKIEYEEEVQGFEQFGYKIIYLRKQES